MYYGDVPEKLVGILSTQQKPSTWVLQLRAFGVTEITRRYGQYGVETPEFTGYNYVSLYWGDEEAQPTRPVTEAEIARINLALLKPF
jgi:hypothetical protein